MKLKIAYRYNKISSPSGIGVHIDDVDPDDWAMLVVTPLMRRAQKITASGEIIRGASERAVASW